MKRVWYMRDTPVVGLSPMDGVTDIAFRETLMRYAVPDVVFTEFTSVDGLRAGATRLLRDFLYTERQRPIVAQLFGSDPEAFYLAAVICASLGFDGIDINMGCPAKNVTHKGAGASLIRDPLRAQEIIRSTQKGVEDWKAGTTVEDLGLAPDFLELVRQRQNDHPFQPADDAVLPVTVKTRIGYATEELDSWMGSLAEAHPAAITLHGRTFKQLYSGSADWEAIGKAAALLRPHGIPVLGNGDVRDKKHALSLSRQYGLAGALIGRAVMGNPWAFTDTVPTFRQRLEAALLHCRLFTELLPEEPFIIMRKHLVQYVKGMDGAAGIRGVLMGLSTYNETERYLRTVIDSY